MFYQRILLFAGVLVACADQTPPVAPAGAGRIQPSETDPVVAILNFEIFGKGATTDWTVETRDGQKRFIASVLSGSPRDLPAGVPRDTIFQYLFDGAPRLGTVSLPEQSVEVMDFGGNPMLVHRDSSANGHTAGTPQLMLFIWPSGTPAPVREIVQSEAATVTITEYVAPVGDSKGRLSGRLEFTGDEWIRQWAADGSATLRRTSAKVLVKARFTVPWEARAQHIDTRQGSP